MNDWMAGGQDLSTPAHDWTEVVGRWAGYAWRLIIIGVLLEIMRDFDTLKATYLGLLQ